MDKLWVLILFNNNNLSSYLLNAVKTSFTEQRRMSTLSNAMYNVEAKCCELILWSLFFFNCQFNFVERRGNIQCSLILFLPLHYQIIFSCNLKQKDHKVPHHATLKCQFILNKQNILKYFCCCEQLPNSFYKYVCQILFIKMPASTSKRFFERGKIIR